MLLCFYILNQVVPVIYLLLIACEWNHSKCLAILITRTNIGAVSTTNTVENANLNAEVHTSHRFWYFHIQCIVAKSINFFVIKNEWTDTSMRTNVCTLITLYTVLWGPFRVECLNTTLFECSRTVLHCTVYHIVLNEIGNFE